MKPKAATLVPLYCHNCLDDNVEYVVYAECEEEQSISHFGRLVMVCKKCGHRNYIGIPKKPVLLEFVPDWETLR